MNIKLKEQAYLAGYEGGFYRFTTDEGKPSIKGIWGEYYTAIAADNNDTEYRVVWEISNREAFDNGDEDCCDWDNPAEILNLDTGLPTEAEIDW